MITQIVLQDILDKIQSTTTVHGGDLNHTVYLQQIRDAILGVSGLKPGSLHEIIYLQQIRNAILGVPDGQFGSLPASIYLQQIVNAYNGVTAGANGNLDEGIYYDEILDVAVPPGSSVPWYQGSGDIPLANIVAAYQPYLAASQAASYTNLVNPGTFTITPGVVFPSWASGTGWDYPLGTNAILNTGITISLASWTVIIRCNVVSSGSSGVGFLATAMNVNWYIQPRNNTLSARTYRNGAAGGVVLQVAGLILGARVFAIADNKAYLDGADDGTITLGAPAAGTLLVGNRATFSRQFNGTIQAMAVYNITLTPAQVVAVGNAMNNI